MQDLRLSVHSILASLILDPCSFNNTANITGFPTLRYFEGGRGHKFTGSRAAQDIVMWLLSFGKEKNVFLTDHEEIENHIKQYPLTTIYFGKRGTKTWESFDRNAKSNSDSAYAYCDSNECMEYYNVSDSQLIVFNSLNVTDFEKRLTIPLNETYEHEHDVLKLVDIYSSPLVMEFGYKTSKIAYIHKRLMIYLFCSDNDKNRNLYIKSFIRDFIL